jgi:hypothetical protein
MTTENISENGTDSEPSPENQSKYADYYEINKEEPTDGNPEEPKVETKVEAGSKSTQPAKVEPAKEPVQEKTAKQHIPDWQRRIDKQTAIIKQQQAEMEALKKSLAKPEKPKLKEENFLTKEEWIRHEARQEAEEVYNSKLAERDAESQKLYQEQAKQAEFAQSWAQTVQKNFEGDAEALEDFKALVRDPEATEHFAQEIHDFIESTPLGGRMLHVLLHRPDLVDQINNAKPIAKASLLLKLEAQTEAYMKQRTQPQAPQAPAVKPISKAPAPIGVFGTKGAALDEEGTDKAMYDKYMKAKFGVR